MTIKLAFLIIIIIGAFLSIIMAWLFDIIFDDEKTNCKEDDNNNRSKYNSDIW